MKFIWKYILLFLYKLERRLKKWIIKYWELGKIKYLIRQRLNFGKQAS